ncbi:MAG: NTP transferase domain-containing protein [Eubacteriales bacterium]|jgi:UDP-N-acetylglucosamine diphosphorylase/glucosamine-1-phosphate N-acetyltransferase|nr:NTP transferase domain-containing protein [Eubacteriales bacterium]
MKAIVMAAGKGTRLTDSENPLPKVLRRANGRPLLAYVLDSVDFLDNNDITIVVGYMADEVKKTFPGRRFVLQGSDGYGTGYAVMCGIKGSGLENVRGEIAVLSGDVPLIKKETIQSMLALHRKEKNACTLLSCRSFKPLPFGRIIRVNGLVTAIKEHRDCTESERLINELNVGMYIFDAPQLFRALSRLNNDNAAGEYYLTDVPKIMLSENKRVNAYVTEDEDELWGVNTSEDLYEVEKILKSRQNIIPRRKRL